MPFEWVLSPIAERALAGLGSELEGAFNRRLGELMRDPTPLNPNVIALPSPRYPSETFGYRAYPFWITFRLQGSIVEVGGLVHNPRGF